MENKKNEVIENEISEIEVKSEESKLNINDDGEIKVNVMEYKCECNKNKNIQLATDVNVSFKKSDNVVQLIKALVAFHSDMKEVEKSSENPFYNSSYADLSQILEVVRPILSAHGLTVAQFIIDGVDKKSVAVKTLLMHESGQFFESDTMSIVPAKSDAQQVGSVTTYLRRYGLQSILMVSFKAEDDDGNSVIPQTKTSSSQAKNNGKKARL